MSQPMFYDYSKRDYLLPPGCKNLIDVLNQPQAAVAWSVFDAQSPLTAAGELLREVLIPCQVTVKALAKLLGLKPFQIVASLLADFKMFKNANEILDFDTAAKISLQFGFKAKKLAF